MYKGIGILSKARKYLNTSTLRTLYFSFIYPHLSFCIEVWGSASNYILEPLFKLQKKAIRIITSSPFKAHTGPLFEMLRLLKLCDIYKYHLNIFMFKIFRRISPSVVMSMFVLNCDVHNLNTRQAQLFHVPYSNSEIFKKSVRYAGVRLFNEIYHLIDINSCFDVHIFKRVIKFQVYII